MKGTISAHYYYDKENFADERMGNPGGGGQYAKNCPYPNGWENQQSGLQKGKWNENGNHTGRNRRSVWTITTKPFKEAHFATFPPEIPEICIKAGTSEKGYCPECGKPWVRVVVKFETGKTQKMPDGFATHEGGHGSFHREGREKGETNKPVMGSKTTGWSPTCTCGLEPIPGLVLDPFMGSGTTGLVAIENGRNFIGIELKQEYVEIAKRRLSGATQQMHIFSKE